MLITVKTWWEGELSVCSPFNKTKTLFDYYVISDLEILCPCLCKDL